MFTSSLLVCILLYFVNSSFAEKDASIVVAMTSIPPRFHSIHHTITSWFTQEQQPVDKICIYIPTKYKRFFRQKKRVGATDLSHVDYLRQILTRESNLLAQAIADRKLVIVEFSQDYGPITRIAGMLRSVFNKSLDQQDDCLGPNEPSPDYWIIGDDDVGYDAQLTQRYLQAVSSLFSTQHYYAAVGLTQFAENYRLELPLSSNDTNALTLIPHVQGVDTYLVNNVHIVMQQQAGVLWYPYFIQAVKFMHDICPESFFQDDYIVSVLFYMSGVRFRTIWDSHVKMVHHIEGVSKSHFQMHMSEDVFRKEAATKACLVQHIAEIRTIVGYTATFSGGIARRDEL